MPKSLVGLVIGFRVNVTVEEARNIIRDLGLTVKHLNEKLWYTQNLRIAVVYVPTKEKHKWVAKLSSRAEVCEVSSVPKPQYH